MTPNILRGNLYPITRQIRCPRFHACTVSHKCQNYDRHLLECRLCEARVHPVPDIVGGYLPEGQYKPDIQAAMKFIRDSMRLAYAHPDRVKQKVNPMNIAENLEKYKKSANIVSKFMSLGVLNFEVETANLWADADDARRYHGL